MKKALVVLSLAVGFGACRPRTGADSQVRSDDSDSFVATLQSVDCVKAAEGNVTSHLPGAKPTGEYTATVQDGVSATACAESIQAALPGVAIGSVNEPSRLIFGIRPSQGTAAPQDVVATLRSLGCVGTATENVSSHMPGGGKATGEFTISVKDGFTAQQCAQDVRTAIAGVRVGTVNDELGTIFGVKLPGYPVPTTSGASFLAQLQNVRCVNDAAADVNSHLPGGGKLTGTYTVTVKPNFKARQCASEIRAKLAGVQIGSISDELATITGLKPATAEGSRGASFAATLGSISCVKDASENVDGSMPGGGKGNGVYTVQVNEGFTVAECANAIRSAVPGVHMDPPNEQYRAILGVEPL